MTKMYGQMGRFKQLLFIIYFFVNGNCRSLACDVIPNQSWSSASINLETIQPDEFAKIVCSYYIRLGFYHFNL